MMAYVVRGILSDPHEQEECLLRCAPGCGSGGRAMTGRDPPPPPGLTALCRNAAYDRLRAQARQRERTGALDETLADPAPARRRSCCKRSGWRPCPGC